MTENREWWSDMPPEKKVELVKQLYGADGGSTSEIAGRVSAHLKQRVSRNSIASLYLRHPSMKLSHPLTGVRMDKGRAEMLNTLPKPTRFPRPKKVKLRPPSAPPAKACAEVPVVRPEPASLDVALLELERGDCRWPTSSDPYRFCGHNTIPGSSYCSFHHKRSWLPATKKASIAT